MLEMYHEDTKTFQDFGFTTVQMVAKIMYVESAYKTPMLLFFFF